MPSREIIVAGHQVDALKFFKVTNERSHFIIMKFVETIAIACLRPDLHVQKQTVAIQSLPWLHYILFASLVISTLSQALIVSFFFDLFLF